MYKVAIVEDNAAEREQLKGFLKDYGEEKQKTFSVTCFPSGINFLSEYNCGYDLVFMDIDMPYMNGLETARMMRKLDEKVALIFVTNLAKYAIKGYEVEAINFIVKPVTYSTFSAKLSKALEHIKVKEDYYLIVSTRSETEKVYVSDIYYVTVSGRYVTLHTKNGEVKYKKSMKEVEKELEKLSFVRGDNSSMVNLRYVTAVTAEGAVVNGETIPYSRNRKKALLDAFTLYLR